MIGMKRNNSSFGLTTSLLRISDVYKTWGQIKQGTREKEEGARKVKDMTGHIRQRVLWCMPSGVQNRGANIPRASSYTPK